MRTSNPEPGDVGDRGGVGGAVGLQPDLDVVGTDQRVAQPGHRADESHHEVVGGPVVQLVGIAHLLDLAVIDDHDPVGDLHRLLLVVGDEHGGHVHLVVQPSQPRPQVLAHVGVERAERLVQQQHLGLDRQRPGEGHALALAAGELRRVAVGKAGQLHQLEQVVDALSGLVLGALADIEAEGDVLAHGHVLERGVVLEHEADAALVRRQLGDVDAADLDLALVGAVEPADHPQERRLTAARRAEQRGQRAVRHLHRDVVQGGEVTEPFRDVRCDDCHVCSPCGA